jgi:dTDP-4-amino-4,6-dideoxygalactose transaminase
VIRFQRPELPSTEAIDRYLELAREERWFSNGGPCWRLLQERLADRTGAYCTPVANGTLGLMVALTAALGGPNGAGGEAVMPSFTFVATAQAAIWCGLRLRLHDVDAGHWHLAPERLEEALQEGRKPGAAIAVSSFGTPPPAEVRTRWERACRKAGVPLVVDSAAGFGAVAEDGVPIGAQGDVEIVSFHATKPFAIGEGGAVFTRDRELHERVELAVNFGFRPDHSVALAHGLNAKMSELHAAAALAMLDRLDDVLAARRRAAAAIRDGAGGGVQWQTGCERSTWQFVPVALADGERRSAVLEACRGAVETRSYYEPLDRLLPPGSVDAGDDLATTGALSARTLSLPMANDLGAEEIAAISAVLADA